MKDCTAHNGIFMIFHSFAYLLFFPIVYIIYFLLPGKVRYICLLAASFFFYAYAGPRYPVFLSVVILSSYVAGLLLSRANAKHHATLSRAVMFLAVAGNIGTLGYFKYTNFLLDNLNHITEALHIDRQFTPVDGLLSLGVSFILFQSVSYIVDVYRGTVSAEKNILKLALYLSFFPKLISGPIERAGNILPQIHKGTRFFLQNLKEGLCLILLGLFYKLVLSDNIAAVINPVFASYADYSGLQIALAVILFAFQIYGDFGGYSYIAIGSAKALGFQLSDNFEAPYHAESVAEFWRRWHMTLNAWLKDYLYIPLGGSRRGFARTCINTMIVFLLSGLWHGADWSFVVWGGLNGLFIVTGNLRRRIREQTHANPRHDTCGNDTGVSQTRPQDTGRTPGHIRPQPDCPRITHIKRKLATFLLVDFAWLFFCMPDIESSFGMIFHAVTQPGIRDLFSLGFLNIFPDIMSFALIIAALFLLLQIDSVIYKKKISFSAFFFQQSPAFRWLFGIIILCMVIFFGAYGEAYEQTQFIYFQF